LRHTGEVQASQHRRCAMLTYVAHLVENSRDFSRSFLQISRVFGSGNGVSAL
jgi:hypothetical protein